MVLHAIQTTQRRLARHGYAFYEFQVIKIPEPSYDGSTPGNRPQKVWNRGVGPAGLADEVQDYLVPDGGRETDENYQTMESVKHVLGDAPDAEL